MKRADKIGARLAIIMGSEELQKGVVSVKDLKDGSQGEVPLQNLAATLKLKLKSAWTVA